MSTNPSNAHSPTPPKIRAGDFVRMKNTPRALACPSFLRADSVLEVDEVHEGNSHTPEDMLSFKRTPGLFYAWRFEVVRRAAIITFIHEGMNIHNPFMDETGRFPYYGFTQYGKQPTRMWRLTDADHILCIDERKDGNHIITCYGAPTINGERSHPTCSHTLNEAIEANERGEI